MPVQSRAEQNRRPSDRRSDMAGRTGEALAAQRLLTASAAAEGGGNPRASTRLPTSSLRFRIQQYLVEL